MSTPNKKKSEEVEFLPDAWERFERAVDRVAKSPPQHRTAKAEREKSQAAEKKKARGAS